MAEEYKKLTAAQFLEKFPDTLRNEGALENFACSRCGQRMLFQIDISRSYEIDDDGVGDSESDFFWDEPSPASCPECNYEGTVGDFTIEGLDALIKERPYDKK